MVNGDLEYIDQTDITGEPGEKPGASIEPDTRNRRANPRTELVTQASVSIPPLSPKALQVRGVSRSGMFLAFKDAATTLLELERAGIGTGANADVAFAVSLGANRHRLNVRAKIARINRHGLGLEFLTPNPPELAALRNLL